MKPCFHDDVLCFLSRGGIPLILPSLAPHLSPQGINVFHVRVSYDRMASLRDKNKATPPVSPRPPFSCPLTLNLSRILPHRVPRPDRWHRNRKMATYTGNLLVSNLNTLSLVATAVEFAYMIHSHEHFTAFENIFFFSAGISEMAGEVLLVSLMFIWLCVRQRAALSHSNGTPEREGGGVEGTGGRHQLSVAEALEYLERSSGTPDEEKEGANGTERRGLSVADAREHLDRLTQDPIHILKATVSEYWHMMDLKSQGKELGANEETNEPLNDEMLLKMIVLVMIALVVTFAPTLVFGFILVVLRGLYGFESDGDEGVMTTLTVTSFVALSVTVAFVAYARSSLQRLWLSLNLYTPPEAYQRLGKDDLKWTLRWTVVGGALVYSVEKLFEVFLLVSRSGRLASDTLEQALIVFQLIELVSVGCIVYYFLLDSIFGNGSSKSSLAQPDPSSRIERMAEEQRKMLDVILEVDEKLSILTEKYTSANQIG